MAGPGGREAGRVTVKVVPDTSGFHRELRAELKKADNEVSVQVRADTAMAAADIAGFRQRMERNAINIPVNADRSALSGLRKALGGLGGITGGAVQGFGNMSRSLTRMTGVMGKGIGMAALLGGAIAGIGAAVMVAGGAITAALGALPALLTTAAAPIAAIALGMEGIKNAAQTLKPEFESLQSTVSATFERGMLPVFESLRGVFPVLQTGLNNVAQTLTGFAQGLADVVSSSQGMENIRRALEGVSQALNLAAPGAQALTTEMLNLAGTSQIYRFIGDTLNGITSGMASFLEQIRTSGALADGLISLQWVFQGLGSALRDIATSALDFFNGVAPALGRFLTQLGESFAAMDWTALGTSLGTVFDTITQAMENLNMSYLTTMFLDLGTAIKNLVNAGGLDALVFLFGALIASTTVVISIITGAIVAFQRIGSAVGSFITWLGNLRNNVTQVGATMTAVLMSVIPNAWNSAVSIVRNAVTTIGNALRQMGTVVVNLARNAWRDFLNATRGGISGVIGFVRSIPGRIRGAMGNLGSILVSSGRALIEGFARGIRNAIGSAVSAARSAVSRVREFFPFSPAKEGPFSGTGYTSYSGLALVEDWAKGIESGTGKAVSAVDKMMQATNAKASAEWQGHITSDSFGGLSGAVHDGVLAAFNGSKLQVDGSGMAKVVNNVNARNKRR